MKKLVLLIKACMNDGMSLFKIKNNHSNKISRVLLPLILTIALFFSIYSYAVMVIEQLIVVNLEVLLLTLFIIIASIMTLIEGIYKSSSLLFNCKDDDLLLSLPISKCTVLFIRIFKFYVFEFLYNSLLLLPAILVYSRYVEVGTEYYLISLLALFLLPIIPIIISCIIGGAISGLSSKFKFKNFVQIILTTLILLLVLYGSFNINNILNNVSQNASNINETIKRFYYPAGAYINLITCFSIQELLLFVVIHLFLFIITIFLFSKLYFKINSRVKVVKTVSGKTSYKIKSNKPMESLIKKEFNRFISSPVFVINAGFGLVLFLVVCIGLSLKFENVIEEIIIEGILIDLSIIKNYIPVLLFGLVCFASLMSSITSSMISLEGRSFNILKSLPIKPGKIVFSKILAAILIMLPFLLIGDLIVFIKFNFNILEIILIILSSLIIPLVSETIGILVNIKYPKMDAENDTQVVKQSMSSMISVFIGMILTGITMYALFKCICYNISSTIIVIYGLLIYTIIYLILLIYLNKISIKEFNTINT